MTNYQVYSCLSRGFSHKDGVCQDYAAHYEDEKLKIAVVSDGHGDKSCFRSDVGSRLAVETALERLQEFARAIEAQGWQDRLRKEDDDQEALMRQLKRSIVGTWDTRVRAHLQGNPLAKEDLERPNRYADYYRRGEMLTHIYGCTLIAAMLMGDLLVMLHVGDGRCVVFDRKGEGSQPVPWDPLCVGNVTTSMCHEDAADRCRHKILHVREDGVLGCFVTTDGIEDSFADLPEQSGLYSYFSNVMARCARMGIAAVVEEMKEELPYISQYGSQDDTSFGAILDMDLAEKLEPRLALVFDMYRCRQEADVARKKLDSMQRKMEILRSNVASAEAGKTAAEQECARQEGWFADAQRELQERNARWETLFQEQLRKIREKLDAWIDEARRKLEECRAGRENSLARQEEAQRKLEQARKALADYTQVHQTYETRHTEAMEKLNSLLQQAEQLKKAEDVPAQQEAPVQQEPEKAVEETVETVEAVEAPCDGQMPQKAVEEEPNPVCEDAEEWEAPRATLTEESAPEEAPEADDFEEIF